METATKPLTLKKERLSELQKWILRQCELQGKIARSEVRHYFGKFFGEHADKKRVNFGKSNNKWRTAEMASLGSTNENAYCSYEAGFWSGYKHPKTELCSTRSIEASISRSLTLLYKNGLIEWEWGMITLTDKGRLKANSVARSGC